VDNKRVVIIGGGTFSHVRNHLSLAAPAFGRTARVLNRICQESFSKMDVVPILTRMAGKNLNRHSAKLLAEIKDKDFDARLITNQDISILLDHLTQDDKTKIIFMSAALVDFDGQIGETISDKHATRLLTNDGETTMRLTPAEKIISKIRKTRKDIFLIGFKTTTGKSADEQYIAGLELCKRASCNLVLANDTVTRLNMVVTPEEARYGVSTVRERTLQELVEIAKLRSHLTFTRSTVVSGEPVPWNSELVPNSLRTVVNYCIEQGAYKPFGGSTAGHFACKLDDQTFLTSIRKTDFNRISEIGLVKVKTDGPDTVIAYGAKPSVGGQSQRIVFNDHPGYDCIVHAHVPIREGSEVPVVSQREFECGSMACGQNTSRGLKQFGNLSAVYLNEHGPNIVFHHSIDPKEVIDFINKNFDLSQKTGGFVSMEAIIASGNTPEMTTLETAERLLK